MGKCEYDLFISYSRKDLKEVTALKENLEQHIPGIKCWIDLAGIEGGDDFVERIATAIDNSAIVLFVVSDNSLESKWTKKEVMYALEEKKRVVPVLLKGAAFNSGWFKFQFSTHDCVYLDDSEQYKKFISNVANWIGSEEQQIPYESPKKRRRKNIFRKSLMIFGGVCLLLLVLGVLLVWRADDPKTNTFSNGVENNHEYIDLGLSVKWATCNVGAEAPEKLGDYYAWGETETKSGYDWGTYKHCYMDEYNDTLLSKYCTDSDYGMVDNKRQLDLSDDVAHVEWGGKWRMPTQKEFEELKGKCTWEWKQRNGMSGYKVTGPNGNNIFLPASGYRDDDSLYGVGLSGGYWSSTLRASNCYNVWRLDFVSDGVNVYYYYRCFGQVVRPVCP